MLSGVPNLFLAFGYTNASWTLRSDLTARAVCRLINHMDRKRLKVCIPESQPWTWNAGPSSISNPAT